MKRLLVCLLLAIVAASSFAANPVRAFDERAWQAIRERHAGKPMIVHFWGMTCAPCLEELPTWRKLHGDVAPIPVVFVQMDNMPVAAVAEKLRASKLSALENWSVIDEVDERLRHVIDPDWIGDVPRTLLIDGNGEMQRMRGRVNAAMVRAWQRRVTGR